MKMKQWTGKVLAAAGCLLLLAILFCPAPVLAATPAIRSIDITIDLHEDGSASFTEVWDVTTADGTEFYIPKYNMEGREISGFTVTDETGAAFTDVGEWDMDLGREEKAGKSGLLQKNGGYELCWGFGTYGDHVYTLRYDMTELVRAYDGADAIYQVLVPKKMYANPQSATVTIRRGGTEFTRDNTGVWAFGFSVDFGVEDGQAVFRSNRAMQNSEYVSVLVEFDKGMFAPAKSIDRSFDSLREEAMEGSNYRPGDGEEGNPENGNNGESSGIANSVRPFMGIGLMGIVAAVIAAVSRGATKGGGQKVNSKAYRDVPYSRELPWGGSLPATYARLGDLHQLKNEGVIIGAYLLRWVRSRQVEMVKQAAGVFKNKEEDAIKLNNPASEMEPLERRLYDMLVAAAGADGILQSKEFEKWSRKNYEKIEGWFEQYKNTGKNHITGMGASAVQQSKMFFGLIPYSKTVMTPLGEQLTTAMMGFKKYLEDFTIINEREAREVQLWDEYLVFAQVFGIAETVAEQFKQLYPAYFQQIETQMGMAPGMYDILWMTHIASRYSRAAYSGYRAGYNAAHSSTYTGGGGSYSGGGGFSGGGFSSGGGTR